jgi:SAM-dependent methyltransferase
MSSSERSPAASPLRNWLVATQFRPGLVGMLSNPFYFARRGLYRHIQGLAGELSGRMLDIGCGQKPYRQLFRVTEHVGLEIDTPDARARKLADAFYDGHRFPFGDASFDCAFASQVFEHVFNPAEFLTEVGRVLRPGGRLLMTMPFVWDEHEQPHDYARYSSFGISHLLTEHGFAVDSLRKSCADFSAVAQTLGMYLYKAAPGKGWSKIATAGLLMAPINIAARALAPLLPANADFFLDVVVLARKQP